MTGRVDVTHHGRAVQLALDSPGRRNALSRTMLADLADALRGMDDSVVGVVICGSAGTFSAGADFADLTGTSSDESYDDAVADVTRTIRELPRLVVAAIEGPCLGAAADLALSCDLRVAAEDSYFAIPAVRLGLLYNPATIDRLRRNFPGDALRRLLLLGERLPAADALTGGLIGQIAPHGQAAACARALIDDLDPSHLDAIAATKGVLNDDSDDPGRAWQQRRRELLDSPTRRAAVDDARNRHMKKGPSRA